MGTPALSSLASTFSPTQSSPPGFPGSGTGRALRTHAPSPPQATSARALPNQAPALSEAYEQAAFRALETRQSSSLQLSTYSARAGGGTNGGSTVALETSQLTFDFFQESRYEEVQFFKQRTNGLGGGGGTRESFFAAREEISARFELSITISGAALNGFASTAEGAGDSDALLARLTEITEKLLGQAEELFNEFFSQLDGGSSEFNAASLEDAFNEFLSGLYNSLDSEIVPFLPPPGGVPAEGGTSGLGSKSVQLEFNFEFSASITRTETAVQQGDPIVLDLDGDGVELSRYQDGAQFDLIGSGRAQQVAFVQGGDAFLALDRNGDGLINSGKELFGEQHGARNGFEELRRFDKNGDGVIDRNDAIYDSLKLFIDNGNGITEAGELVGLAEKGITEIDLGYREVDERAAGGNRIAQVASFLRSDGSRGQAVDALLNYIA